MLDFFYFFGVHAIMTVGMINYGLGYLLRGSKWLMIFVMVVHIDFLVLTIFFLIVGFVDQFQFIALIVRFRSIFANGNFCRLDLIVFLLFWMLKYGNGERRSENCVIYGTNTLNRNCFSSIFFSKHYSTFISIIQNGKRL